MQETRVQSLGREDPLEKEMPTNSYYSCLENPMDRGAWHYSPWSHRVVHGIATEQTTVEASVTLICQFQKVQVQGCSKPQTAEPAVAFQWARLPPSSDHS